MRKILLGCVASAAMFAIPSAANAAVILTTGATFNIPASNDFQGQLAGLGLTRYTTTGASLVLDEASTITFEFLGSESQFNDTFNALGTPLRSHTENTHFTDNFASPFVIGASNFAAGSLAGLLNFTTLNPNGATATVGQDGFGIFLGPNQTTGPVNIFYLGYDDQIVGQDDNHDDFIVRATVRNAVPEPGTWAMMLIGFGAVGFGLRRRRKQDARVRFNFA